ncbi:MAG TPA: hypothetical protein VGA59_12645 [Ramlibacter sp.]
MITTNPQIDSGSDAQRDTLAAVMEGTVAMVLRQLLEWLRMASSPTLATNDDLPNSKSMAT